MQEIKIGKIMIPAIKGDPGTTLYSKLDDKPKINEIELEGNKTLAELGIQPVGDYALKEEIPEVDEFIKKDVNNLDNYYPKTQVYTKEEIEEEYALKDELPDTSNFISRTVNNLANYYLKDETYTKEEVLILIGNIGTVSIQKVTQLPETASNNIIYLVPREGPETDVHDEYLYVDNKWELIGSTQVDLNNFYSKEEINSKVKDLMERDTSVYLWDQKSSTDNPNNIELWQNIYDDAKKNKNVFVFLAGSFKNDLFFYFNSEIESEILIKPIGNKIVDSTLTNCSGIFRSSCSVKIKVENGIVINVTYLNTSSEISRYLSANKIYSAEYFPQYPGSPVNKKYVDDSITKAKEEIMEKEEVFSSAEGTSENILFNYDNNKFNYLRIYYYYINHNGGYDYLEKDFPIRYVSGIGQVVLEAGEWITPKKYRKAIYNATLKDNGFIVNHSATLDFDISTEKVTAGDGAKIKIMTISQINK